MSTPTGRLLIVGAGSLGREVHGWIRNDRAWKGTAFGGFLSDDPNSLASHPHYSPGIIGPVQSFVPLAGDRLVMAISDPKSKLILADLLESKGGAFVPYVHPTAILSDHVKLGRGVVICPNVVVSCDAAIGDFATINIGCTIGHDVVLGRGATLSAHVDITGFASVGEGAFFGSHASILPRAKVGAYAKVGAGTVVLRSVNPGATVMGVPAKQILP